MPKYSKQHGFTLIELMITLAVIALLAGIASPSLQRWSSAYRLKSAATDLFSNMQLAKIGSMKENDAWNIYFTKTGTKTGYEIKNGNNKKVKSIEFNDRYKGEILYKGPTSDPTVETNPLTFHPDGTTKTGFVYISNTANSRYYRIGIPYTSGILRIQKWNGSAWE